VGACHLPFSCSRVLSSLLGEGSNATPAIQPMRSCRSEPCCCSHPRSTCLKVEGMRLQGLQPGAPLTLESLTARHATLLAEARAMLQEVNWQGVCPVHGQRNNGGVQAMSLQVRF
jgi:hypothetical protein